MMKVTDMMRFTLTPIRLAMDGFSAVARMARPSRVKLTKASSPAITSAAVAMMMICVSVI